MADENQAAEAEVLAAVTEGMGDDGLEKGPMTGDLPVETPVAEQAEEVHEEAEDPNIPPEPPPSEGEAEASDVEVLKSYDERHGTHFSEKFRSLEDALSSQQELESRLGQKDEDAAAWRAFAQDPDRYLDQLRPPVPGEPEGAGEGDRPEFEWDWYNQVTADEAGNPVAKPGYDQDIPQKLAKAENYMRQRMVELAFAEEQAPPDQLTDHQASQVQQIIQGTLGQAEQQSAQRNEAVGVLERNRHWIFEGGDPSKGKTRRGEAYTGYVQDAINKGMASAADQDEYAQMKMHAAAAAHTTREPVSPTRRANVQLEDTPDEYYKTGEDLTAAVMRNLQRAGVRPE